MTCIPSNNFIFFPLPPPQMEKNIYSYQERFYCSVKHKTRSSRMQGRRKEKGQKERKFVFCSYLIILQLFYLY